MSKKDLDALVEQIRYIILNKPILEELKSESEELADLQEAIVYLSNCLSESNEFLRHLSIGNLDATLPSRHNFLSGSLKELHSGLKHLTWQANQVAKGDYNQRVSFLGEFSEAFNQMISQLSEREAKLKAQSANLAETNRLMKAIMNGLKEWIVVTSKEHGEVIYVNQAAKQTFFDIDTKKHICGKPCQLMEQLKSDKNGMEEKLVFEFQCEISKKLLLIRSFLIQWDENLAYVHYISDITNQRASQKAIESMAYSDELTNLFNRRYCYKSLNKYLEQNREFSLCIIDLDGLKFANDTYGHDAGDQYLKTVATGMTALASTSDIVCRIGGDEFAIIFQNDKMEEILNKMGRLDESLKLQSKSYPMSISYGVIHVESAVKSGSKLMAKTIMAQADKQMYMMKKSKKTTDNNGI